MSVLFTKRMIACLTGLEAFMSDQCQSQIHNDMIQQINKINKYVRAQLWQTNIQGE